MGEGGRRGKRGDPPPGDGGARLGKCRVVVPARATQREGRRAGRLGGELQAAGRGECEATGQLAHHASEAPASLTAMAQRLFQYPQHSGGTVRLGVDDPVRMQPHASQAGGEQVVLMQHPEHRAPRVRGAAEQTGDEQGGGRSVLYLRPAASHLVQRRTSQAMSR